MFYGRQDPFDDPFWQERATEISSRSAIEPVAAFADEWLNEELVLSAEAHWRDVPVIAGEFVKCRRALCHPSVARPIAYIDGSLRATCSAAFARA
jgi:hypothetical protein